MYSEIINKKKDIIEVIKNGIEGINTPVSQTLGSHGKYVCLEYHPGKYKYTKDGVSIAQNVQLDNSAENSVTQSIVDASNATLSKIGDGTTTTVVLASALINSFIDRYEKSNINLREYTDAFTFCMDRINEMKKEEVNKISPTEDVIEKVATTSANGDKKLGKIIGDVYKKVGAEGHIKLDYNEKNVEMSIKYEEGYVIDEGFLAREFLSFPKLIEPLVLVTNKPIIDAQNFLDQIMSIAFEKERSLFVIASDYSKEVLSTIVKNLDKVVVVPIKAPEQGEAKDSYLEDIAKLSGCVFVDSNKDMEFSDIHNDELLGDMIKEVIIRTEETILVVNKDHKKYESHKLKINQHIDKLKSISNELENNEYALMFNNRRLAKFSGNVATIEFPVTTRTEMSYDYDRYDDAIKATKNALKNGVAIGGGKMYLHFSKELDKLIINEEFNKNLSEDFKNGMLDFSNSLHSVTKQSLINSGVDNIDNVFHKLYYDLTHEIGYDTITKEMVDFRKEGILESYLSSFTCLNNATSVAKKIMNTGSFIIKVPEII